MVSLPTKKVSDEIATQLDFGNKVIEMVRRKMPYGAANQRVDMRMSNQEANPRTAQGYNRFNEARMYFGKIGPKPKLLAGVAEKFGAGNCDMAGAMAYTIMRRTLSDDFEVMFIEGKGHTYSAFKIVDQPDSAAIVVDPWPTSGMATLAVDHFMGLGGRSTVLRKRGKGPNPVTELIDRVALSEKYQEMLPALDSDLENLPSIQRGNFKVFRHDLCSTTVGAYQRPDGKIVATPKERVMMPPPPIPWADSDVVMGDIERPFTPPSPRPAIDTGTDIVMGEG